METPEQVLDRWVTWDHDLEAAADKIFFLKAMEEYASQFKSIPPLTVEDKEEQEKLWNEIAEVHKTSQWFSGDALNYIKRNYNLTRKQLE